MGSRIQLPDDVAAVFITEQLASRASAAPNFLREKLAIQDLAQVMSEQPKEILPRLVKLGMDICEAHSAGISIYESKSAQFRWFALAGKLATFEGTTTPRNSSPCGVCLDLSEPILMEQPERAYGWIGEAGITVPEVLLVPLIVKGVEPVGTLWLVADHAGQFNKEHSRVMSELAAFAGMALRMIQGENQLQLALEQQDTLVREMSHRIKNLFAVADSMVRATARNALTKEELAETVSGRLHALAQANGLIRRTFGDEIAVAVDFQELIKLVLLPHEHGPSTLIGPPLSLGEQATNHLALIFHELATNAAKYGALQAEKGSVTVTWTIDKEQVQFVWTEKGAIKVEPPTRAGFGTKQFARR